MDPWWIIGKSLPYRNPIWGAPICPRLQQLKGWRTSSHKHVDHCPSKFITPRSIFFYCMYIMATNMLKSTQKSTKKKHIITTSSFFFLSWFIQNCQGQRCSCTTFCSTCGLGIGRESCTLGNVLSRPRSGDSTNLWDLLGRKTDEKMMTWGFLPYISRWWFFKSMFIFTPTWGNDTIWLIHIFQMGWNHQLEWYVFQDICV